MPMSSLYGYGNTVTKSGSYTLFPALWILGVASLGGADATFEGSNVTATLSFAPTIIGAINPYSVTAEDGANVTVNVGSTVLGLLTGSTFTADGGTISLTGANVITALTGTTYNIKNGGTLNLGVVQQSEISALSGAGITFGSGGGTLVVTPASGVEILTFTNIDGFSNAGATIEVPGAGYVTNATYNGTDTTITTNTGITVVVNGDYTPATKTLYQATSGGNLYLSATAQNSTDTTGVLVCFLPGSMIRTPKGDVAVENLVVGQEVLAFTADGQPIARRITWAGKAQARTNPAAADDLAGYPVRVRANAIAAGVPEADLLITPEHCLYLQGQFVPARMLVNGTSIAYDTSFASYDYYHIETEGHAIIMANGMLTESYLDTGNRSSFTQAGPVARIGGAVKSWAQDAAAKLETSRTFVEPLFRTLAERGSTLYANTAAQSTEKSAQPNLHLVTAQGHTVHPLRHENGMYTFMLSAQGAQSVSLVSRTFRPCDAEGPFVDDRRMLGVAVGHISITSAGTRQPVTAHLTTDTLEGWHAVEVSGQARWTNGHAKLPLPASLQGLCQLHVQVLATGAYTVAAHNAQAKAALA
ncbi:Hint domain-containing protein [Acetobacter oryzifermentans]|uniref:Hint domain-containing protein n=1 Tax=Acetobacter oryzifermentans TaxID=1633874 RepID=UPI0039BF29C7